MAAREHGPKVERGKEGKKGLKEKIASIKDYILFHFCFFRFAKWGNKDDKMSDRGARVEEVKKERELEIMGDDKKEFLKRIHFYSSDDSEEDAESRELEVNRDHSRRSQERILCKWLHSDSTDDSEEDEESLQFNFDYEFDTNIKGLKKELRAYHSF